MRGITHYEQAVDDLFRNCLHDTALSALKLTPKQHLITFHLTLGTRIRVLYNMWQNEELVASTGTNHPDAASLFIIVKLWEYLQGVDIPLFSNASESSESDLKSQQKAYARYREAMGDILELEQIVG